MAMSTISVFNQLTAEIPGDGGTAERFQNPCQKGSAEFVWMFTVPDEEPLGELVI